MQQRDLHGNGTTLNGRCFTLPLKTVTFQRSAIILPHEPSIHRHGPHQQQRQQQWAHSFHSLAAPTSRSPRVRQPRNNLANSYRHASSGTVGDSSGNTGRSFNLIQMGQPILAADLMSSQSNFSQHEGIQLLEATGQSHRRHCLGFSRNEDFNNPTQTRGRVACPPAAAT